MGSFRRACLVAALAALALVPSAQALNRQRVGVLQSPSYAKLHDRKVTTIVIHVAETSFWGTVRTLTDPDRPASAHFVVSKEGEVVRLVDPNDVAWHAGNKAVNETSIGIEHEGFTYVKGSLTDAEIDASARLVAYLATRYSIPIDRKHLIGHDEVPDPLRPGLFGGADHHTDPGPYWDWDRYLDLVRTYAQEPEQPRFQRVLASARPTRPERRIKCFTRSLHSSTVAAGQTVSGLVDWRAKACGRALHRVDFLVDGKLLWADRERPFGFGGGRGWNTTGLADGWHSLSLRAYGPNGYRIRRDLRVRVENPDYALDVTGLAAGQTLVHDAVFGVKPSAATRRVELRLDGNTVAVQTAAPFSFDWDPVDAAPGTHDLELRAQAWDGRTATVTLPLEVEHPLASPAAAALMTDLSS